MTEDFVRSLFLIMSNFSFLNCVSDLLFYDLLTYLEKMSKLVFMLFALLANCWLSLQVILTLIQMHKGFVHSDLAHLASLAA